MSFCLLVCVEHFEQYSIEQCSVLGGPKKSTFRGPGVYLWSKPHHLPISKNAKYYFKTSLSAINVTLLWSKPPNKISIVIPGYI